MRACFLLYVLCIFRIKASIKIRCGIGEIRGKGDIFLELSYWSKDITYCILTKDDGVHEKTVLHFDRYDEYNSFDSESKWNMCVKLLQKHYNSFSANVTFSNVSNNHATKWTFKCNVLSSKAVYTDSCNLKIFERPSNVECDPQYSPTLNLVCTAVGMFNNSKCTFYVTLNNSDHYEQTNISYGNKDGKPRCSLHLQSVDVGTEYNITVTIYPNVTGNDTDIQFGSSKTFTDDGQQITAYTTMNNSMFSPNFSRPTTIEKQFLCNEIEEEISVTTYSFMPKDLYESLSFPLRNLTSQECNVSNLSFQNVTLCVNTSSLSAPRSFVCLTDEDNVFIYCYVNGTIKIVCFKNDKRSRARAFMLLLIVSSTLVLVSASLTTYALRKYKEGPEASLKKATLVRLCLVTDTHQTSDYIVLCEKGISYRRLSYKHR
ncbi:uncharacterized protein LOC106058223 isoform X3 [Biomphalaria glabrata]|uniref:Uncharacterized protein LOC106058223 isoform X3 n=1 Tax=Biomphalaria glabrata TaxID=6526 RepID=A0A9W2YVF0_BIOGL|nr:uncharacterized protein LOC106058223 isoform X3 [Biomphalaria glabrata]